MVTYGLTAPGGVLSIRRAGFRDCATRPLTSTTWSARIPTGTQPGVRPRCLDTTQRAEGVGFEPTVPLRAQRFSRPSDSATLASLRVTLLAIPGTPRLALAFERCTQPLRRSVKNEVSRAAHSSASTPAVTGTSWFSLGSTKRLYREPTAPALGSAAP